METEKKIDYKEYFLTDNSSGWKTTEKKLMNNNIELYDKIIKYNDLDNTLSKLPFKQKVWHFINLINSIPQCLECNKELKFKRSLSEGYGEYCSLNCCNKHFKHKESAKIGIAKWHDNLSSEEIKEITNKHINTMKERYGVDNIMHDEKTLQKVKETNKQSFFESVNKKYDNFFDYTKSNYINISEPIEIICPKHGSFIVSPKHHLYSTCGCDGCNNYSMNIIRFKEKSNIKHDFKYDYSLVNYIDYITKVEIICPIHRNFFQSPKNHLKGGCIKCGNTLHLLETELKIFITSNNIEIIENDTTILKPKHLDVFIPSLKLAFEFNGVHWHSEIYKDKNYHLNKTNECEKQGVQLIHIFEDEWLYKQEIVKSRIKNIFGLTETKIHVIKCLIKEVSTKKTIEFLNNNHIQGDLKPKIKLGLYHNNEIVSLMCFDDYNAEEETYELVRFCDKLNTNVIGGADKLLKHFINIYNPKKIISYADRRWCQGKLYEKLGFTFIDCSEPNYFYVIDRKRECRFKYQKNILIKEGFDVNKSEHQIMLDRGIYRIYDCGTKKYELILDK